MFEVSGGYQQMAYELSVTCAPCDIPNPTATPTFTHTPMPTPLPPDSFEPDDTPADAKPIACGEGQLGTVAPSGNSDWIRFTLPEAAAVRIEALGLGGSLRLALYDAAQTVLYDGTFDTITRQCGRDILEAGTYFVRASGYDDVPYFLGLSCLSCPLANPPKPAPDVFEPDDNPGEAKPISCGETQRRSIVPEDDVDWVSFELTDFSEVEIGGAVGSLGGVWLALHDADGGALGFESSGGLERNCGHDALEPGTYLVRARHLVRISGYDLRLTCRRCSVPNPTPTATRTPTATFTSTPTVAPDAYEPDDDPAEAKRITCGQLQRRSLTPGDVDWLAFSLPARNSVRVRLTREHYHYFGWELLLAQDEEVLDSADNLIERECGVDALDPGDYLIQVAWSFGDPSPYQIELICVPCPLPNPAGHAAGHRSDEAIHR